MRVTPAKQAAAPTIAYNPGVMQLSPSGHAFLNICKWLYDLDRNKK